MTIEEYFKEIDEENILAITLIEKVLRLNIYSKDNRIDKIEFSNITTNADFENFFRNKKNFVVLNNHISKYKIALNKNYIKFFENKQLVIRFNYRLEVFYLTTVKNNGLPQNILIEFYKTDFKELSKIVDLTILSLIEEIDSYKDWGTESELNILMNNIKYLKDNVFSSEENLLLEMIL